MRGMQRLANLAPTLMNDIDNRADAVADRLTKGKDRAFGAIDKYGDLAGALEATADSVEAALGQISNDPTKVSSG